MKFRHRLECLRGAYAAANKCEKFNIEKRVVLSALTLFGSNRLSSAIFPMKHPLRMECCGLVRTARSHDVSLRTTEPVGLAIVQLL